MFVMYGDEADAEQGRGQKVFVYGGVFIPVACIQRLHDTIEGMRAKYGFREGDSLKFASRTCPAHVTRDDHTKIKNDVMIVAEDCGAKFCAYAALHDIVKSQKDQYIQWGCNTILGRFNEFCGLNKTYGIAQLDRMSAGNAWDYICEKFSKGNEFGGKWMRLERITALGFTCDGASHLASVCDIILGSFRYCVNEEDKDIAGNAMFPQIVDLMWKKEKDNKEYVRDIGLTLAPKVVKVPKYQEEYDALSNRLQTYLDEKRSAHSTKSANAAK
jgi:hypothetical protein